MTLFNDDTTHILVNYQSIDPFEIDKNEKATNDILNWVYNNKLTIIYSKIVILQFHPLNK